MREIRNEKDLLGVEYVKVLLDKNLWHSEVAYGFFAQNDVIFLTAWENEKGDIEYISRKLDPTKRHIKTLNLWDTNSKSNNTELHINKKEIFNKGLFEVKDKYLQGTIKEGYINAMNDGPEIFFLTITTVAEFVKRNFNWLKGFYEGKWCDDGGFFSILDTRQETQTMYKNLPKDAFHPQNLNFTGGKDFYEWAFSEGISYKTFKVGIVKEAILREFLKMKG